MTNSSSLATIGRILNLVSGVANLLALLISMIILCLVIYRLICLKYNQGRIRLEIPVILSFNTLAMLIVRSVIQFVAVDLRTIRLYYGFIVAPEDSLACRLSGYFLLSVHIALYWSYALQAGFCFARVVHPQRLWLQQIKTYPCVFIPGQFVISFASMFPLFMGFNIIRLLPNEAYCIVSYDELASLTYMPIVGYVLPMSSISVFYTCIVWKMRHLSPARPNQRRNQRDCLVIRRIIILICILSLVSLPLIVDLIIFAPQGYIDPNMNSIGWVASSVDAVILAISVPFITPQVLEFLKVAPSPNHT